MKNFMDKNPIIGCIITEVIFLMFFLIMNFIIEILHIDTDIYNVYIAKEIVMTIVSFLFMYLWGKNYVLKKILNSKNISGGC